MPVNAKFDFILNHNGYMLARPPKGGPRSWQRSGTPDTPTVEQPRLASEFGGLPGQIDYPEVWNDWSGGFGYAYRHPLDENSYFGFLSNPNTYHWAENFDARFSRQLVHAQKFSKYPSMNGGEYFLSVPHPNIFNASFFLPPAGEGALVVIDNFVNSHQIEVIRPTGSGNAPFAEFGAVTNQTISYGYRPAIFGSYVYVPCLDGRGLVQMDLQGSQFGFVSGGTLPVQVLTTAGNLLWAAMGPVPRGATFLRNLANPDATAARDPGNWSATINVGNGASPIVDMIELEGQIYCGLNNGLYVGDSSGTFVNVLPDMQNQVHYDNCRDLAVYNSEIIVPHIGGLYSYNPVGNTARAAEIGPQPHSNRSPVNGYFRCAKPLGKWLYGGLFTGSVSYVMAGYDDRQNSGKFVWHPMQRLPETSRIHRLHFDGITAVPMTSFSLGFQIPNRMWVSTDPTINTGGTSPIYYMTIPFLNDNPLVPQVGFTANYSNSARMDLGITDGRTPGTPKIYRQCEVWADNLDGSQRWGLIYYTVDGGARTLLGTVNSSPKSVLYFPSSEGSFVMGQGIELSLESYIKAGAEATTPIYRSIILRQTQVPRSIDIIQATVDIGDEMRDRKGSKMRPGKNQINELRDLAGTGPVLLTDIIGNTWWAKVLAPVEEQEEWQDGATNPSVLANIKLAIMSFAGP